MISYHRHLEEGGEQQRKLLSFLNKYIVNRRHSVIAALHGTRVSIMELYEMLSSDHSERAV